MPESLFLISCRPEACNFIKRETLTQVFSCEFCEISKSTLSYRTSPVAASVFQYPSLNTSFVKNIFDHRGVLQTKVILKKSQNSQEKTPVLDSPS